MPFGRRNHARGSRCRRQERDPAAVRRRLSARPARPAPEHVPGLRFAARRSAHAPHPDHPVRIGLLRLRPDLHLAFLWRTPQRRLRPLQFRESGHRQALRRHPRIGACPGRSREIRRDRHHQPVCADRQRRAAATAAQRDQRCANHRHRRAGVRCADPCRSQGCAGRRDAEICPRRNHRRPGSGTAHRARSKAHHHAARRNLPGRSGDHRHDARADGSGRRPGGADPRMA